MLMNQISDQQVGSESVYRKKEQSSARKNIHGKVTSSVSTLDYIPILWMLLHSSPGVDRRTPGDSKDIDSRY